MKRLAAALEKARATRSRIAKETALGEALRDIGTDADDVALATAARLCTGRPLPVGDGRTLGVGWSVMNETVIAHTGYEGDVVGACARRTGDLGEAFALLVARDASSHARLGLSLAHAARLMDDLASSGTRLGKRRLLDAAFACATPLETKYLAKALLGELRIGAQGGVLEGAIARAFEVPLDDVRRAAALVTDPGIVAVLARGRRLHEAALEIGRPLAFMLATPMETIAGAIDPEKHVAEDKIDGVRAQVHKQGSDVVIFGRGLERVTVSFPEVVDAFQFVRGRVVLDGEILVVGEGRRPRPFQALQQRLRKTAPDAAMLASHPVAFFAYDLLAWGDDVLLDLPWAERRRRLEAFAREQPPHAAFVVNEYRALDPAAPLASTLDVEFAAARARGHEGLVLKRVDAPYEAGRRGQSWIKLKRALATLDVVVTAAEEGHGRRAGILSDYTFAVWKGGELANVGKAYSGLSDDEIDLLTRRLERITSERFGGVRLIEPAIVLEVAFDGIQKSARHKSGYALRFPRIVRVRDDKKPDEADRIEAVEALFASQLESGHREETEAPPPARGRGGKSKRAAKPSAQLTLFDAAPPKRSSSRRPRPCTARGTDAGAPSSRRRSIRPHRGLGARPGRASR